MSCLQPRINIIQVLLENFTACRPQFSHHFIPPLLLLPPSHSRTSYTDGTELLSSEPADRLQDLCLPAPHSRLAVNQLCLYRNLKWLHPLSSLWQKGLSGNKQNQNKTWLKIHIDDDPHQTHRKPHLADEMLWANKKCCNTPVSVQEGSRGVSKSDQQGEKKKCHALWIFIAQLLFFLEFMGLEQCFHFYFSCFDSAILRFICLLL